MTKSLQPLWTLFVEPIKYTLSEPSSNPVWQQPILTFVASADVIVQPSEQNDPSERHLTKAVILMKGTAVLKKTGGEWENHYSCVLTAAR